MVTSLLSQPKVCSNKGVARNEPGCPGSCRMSLPKCARSPASVILSTPRVDSVVRDKACSTSVEKYLLMDWRCLLWIYNGVQQAVLIYRVEPIGVEIPDLAEKENGFTAVFEHICKQCITAGYSSSKDREVNHSIPVVHFRGKRNYAICLAQSPALQF